VYIYNKTVDMSKTQNRKTYKHNIDLIKYSEDGERKRCVLCVEEKEPHEISSKTSYCKPCWADYMRCKRNGTLDMLKEQYAPKWEVLREKYKDVKKCNTCLEIKHKVEFYPDKKAPHGYQNKCISCVKDYNKINGYISERDLKYQNKRRKNNIQYKLKDIIQKTIHSNLKERKINKTLDYIGCSVGFLIEYLESRFLPEMSWNNHGKIWEIDHIKPCASFDLTDPQQQKICFHYTNLQPLFKTSDIAKSFGYIEHIGNRNKGKKFNI